MPRDNSTDPWGDAANQAVGAMYKYYMSQPTAADQMKLQLQQAQLQELQQKSPLELQKLQIDNQLNQRMYDSGAYPGMPAPIQNFNYRQNQTSGDATQIFDAYVNPPDTLDLGDSQQITSKVTGDPISQFMKGAPPRIEVNKEGREYIPIPAIPSSSRPVMPASPAASIFGQQYDNADDPMAASQAAIAALGGTGANPYQNDIGAVPMTIEDVIAALGGTGDVPTAPDTTNQNEAMLPQMDGPIPFGNSKSPVDVSKQNQARASVTNSIGIMAKAYNDLKAGGGAILPDQKVLTQNIPNYLANTFIGQEIGNAVGSESQSLRNLIATQKPALMGAVRQASEMGVKGMDSEKELQFYLNALGDPKMDVKVSLAALQALNDNLGLGAERFADPAAVEQIREMARQQLQVPTSPVGSNMTTNAPDFDNMSEEELDRYISEHNGR